MSILRGRDVPTLGAADQTGQGSQDQNGEGVPISLHELQAHISPISTRDHTRAAKRTDQAAGDDLLEAGNELPGDRGTPVRAGGEVEPD